MYSKRIMEILYGAKERSSQVFTDFSLGRYYEVWTQQRRSVRRWKLSEQNFILLQWSFLQKKKQKMLTKFPGLATSNHHNSAMITDAENELPNDPPTGCLVSIFTVRINSKSFPWALRSVQVARPICLSRIP